MLENQTKKPEQQTIDLRKNKIISYKQEILEPKRNKKQKMNSMNIQKYIIDHTKEYTETVKAIIECESELIKDPINHGKELYEFAKKEWEDATEFYNEAIRPIPSYLNIIKKYGKIRIIDIPRNTRDTQNYEL